MAFLCPRRTTSPWYLGLNPRLSESLYVCFVARPAVDHDNGSRPECAQTRNRVFQVHRREAVIEIRGQEDAGGRRIHSPTTSRSWYISYPEQLAWQTQ